VFAAPTPIFAACHITFAGWARTAVGCAPPPALRGPGMDLKEVEFATLERVAWY
jgi:hypothetical protein